MKFEGFSAVKGKAFKASSLDLDTQLPSVNLSILILQKIHTAV